MTDSHLIELIRSLSTPMRPLPTGIPARLRPLPGIRWVLWDVYGTLLVSGSGDIGTAGATCDREAIVRSLRAVGIAADSLPADVSLRPVIEDHHARLRNEGIDYPEIDIRDVWKEATDQWRACGYLSRPVPADRIEELAVHHECLVNPVWPMPGLIEALTQIKHHVSMGIISNAQFFTPILFPALTDRTLEQLGCPTDVQYFSYRYRVAKPSTKLFQMAIRQASDQDSVPLDPAQTLYVGNDLRNDVWPAQQCGMRTALFAGDRRSLRLREDRPELAQCQPDIVLTDPHDLLECIKT